MGEVVKCFTKEEVEKHAFFLALDCLCVTFAIGEDKSPKEQKKLAKVNIDSFKEIFEKDCPEHKKFGVSFKEIAQGIFFELMVDEDFRTSVLDLSKNRIEEIKAEHSNYLTSLK